MLHLAYDCPAGVTTITARSNRGVLSLNPLDTGQFALYLFLFFGGQILNRLTVELQITNLNRSLPSRQSS